MNQGLMYAGRLDQLAYAIAKATKSPKPYTHRALGMVQAYAIMTGDQDNAEAVMFTDIIDECKGIALAMGWEG